MPRRSKSSARWLAEHASDPYVQRAREEGWRSRAVFKLEEIQRSDQLLKPGMTVVDLGAAPGGWSQYAARILAGRGRVIAVDILPMAGLTGVEVLQGDFSEQATLDRLVGLLDGARGRPCFVGHGPQHNGHCGGGPRPLDASGGPRDGFRRAGPAARRRPAVEGFSRPRVSATGGPPAGGLQNSEAPQAESVQRSQPRGVRSGTWVSIGVVSNETVSGPCREVGPVFRGLRN